MGGISGVGEAVGRGTMGYYSGKSARNRSEDHDYDEDRRRKIHGILDPIKMREAELSLRGNERDDEAETKNQPHRLEKQEQEARLGKRTDEASEHAKQYDPERIDRDNRKGIRTDQIEEAALPGDVKSAGYGVNRAERAETAEQQIGDELTTRFDMKGIIRGAERAIENFEMSGSPQAYEDFYNREVPNGNDIKIMEDPSHPGGFIAEAANGELTYWKDAAEMTQVFKDFWLSEERMSDAFGGQRNNRGIGRGRYGSSATGAKNQMIENLVGALKDSGQGEGKTDGELYLDAYQYATQKSGEDPVEMTWGLYETLIKQFIPTGDFVSDEDRQRGELLAAQFAAKMAMSFGLQDLANQFLDGDQQGNNEGGSGITEPRQSPVPTDSGTEDYIGDILQQTTGR